MSSRRRITPSPGFLHALAGIGLTIFSWYSPWSWPALPALTVLELIGGETDWLQLGETLRGTILVALITINITAWGAVSWLITTSIQRARARSTRTKPQAQDAT